MSLFGKKKARYGYTFDYHLMLYVITDPDGKPTGEHAVTANEAKERIEKKNRAIDD